MLAGDVSSIRRLDQAIVQRVTGATVVRVNLWAHAKLGRFQIVYSDDHRLIGAVYKLQAEEQQALRGNRVDADLSDASRLENHFERGQGQVAGTAQPGVGRGKGPGLVG